MEEGITLSWEADGKTYYLGYGLNESSQNCVIISEEVTYLKLNTTYNSIEDPEGKYFLGTFSNFTTMSWCGVSYYGEDYIAHLYTEAQTNPEPPAATELQLVTSITDGGEYYWAYNDNGVYRYFNGKTVSTYYLNVTDDIDSAVLVKTTAVDGGWKLTFNNDASTIFAYPYNTSLDFEISTTGTSSQSGASSTWEWDTTYNIVTITLSNGKFYPEYYNSRIQGNGYNYINDNGSPKLGFQFYSLVTA